MAPKIKYAKIHPFGHLEGRVYSCRQCQLHIASDRQRFPFLAFDAFNKQADLFNGVHDVNVLYGDYIYRVMEGRPFGGRDLYCASCHSVVGWEYMFVFTIGDLFRKGKFQLEKNLVKGPDA